MPKVLISLSSRHRVWNLDPKYPGIIAEKFPQLEVVAAKGQDEFLQHIPDAEILYTWSLPERHLARAGRLRWIHTPFAGVDEALYPALVESPIRMTCSRGVSAAALADHALGMMLSFSRGLAVAIREQEKGWARDRFFDANPMPVELDGKVLGILGFGSIGREVARRGRAFGMRVFALKRNQIQSDPLVDRLFGSMQLHEFLALADYLVMTLPWTPSTDGILDERAFAAMKPTAVLVNIARGKLIREESLAKALESGRLAGAALDVFVEEPLPSTSVFYRHPNVVLTPHIAGLHPHYLDRSTSLFIVNLGRYLKGDSLLHEVVKREGY
ncbi:MAG: D-2-hydroxyacid dehydrogenase [Acidobacteria bacterium]|nr:D-2-hydroxyacid dehydrogenase [Acidobacteriota bacterium]